MVTVVIIITINVFLEVSKTFSWTTTVLRINLPFRYTYGGSYNSIGRFDRGGEGNLLNVCASLLVTYPFLNLSFFPPLGNPVTSPRLPIPRAARNTTLAVPRMEKATVDPRRPTTTTIAAVDTTHTTRSAWTQTPPRLAAATAPTECSAAPSSPSSARRTPAWWRPPPRNRRRVSRRADIRRQRLPLPLQRGSAWDRAGTSRRGCPTTWCRTRSATSD